MHRGKNRTEGRIEEVHRSRDWVLIVGTADVSVSRSSTLITGKTLVNVVDVFTSVNKYFI